MKNIGEESKNFFESSFSTKLKPVFQISKQQHKLLSGHLTLQIYKRVRRLHQEHSQTSAGVFSKEKAQASDAEILQFVIDDILATGHYTLHGIAAEIRVPYEVMYEIVAGINSNPSWTIGIQLFKLHNQLRPGLYDELVKKLTSLFQEQTYLTHCQRCSCLINTDNAA